MIIDSLFADKFFLFRVLDALRFFQALRFLCCRGVSPYYQDFPSNCPHERSHAYRQPGARCPAESGQSIEIVSIECIHRSWTAGLLQPNAVPYAS